MMRMVFSPPVVFSSITLLLLVIASVLVAIYGMLGRICDLLCRIRDMLFESER